MIGTLGKALGSYGAFACCSAQTADYLVNRARTMIYSTALPPPALGAALAALAIHTGMIPPTAGARAVRGLDLVWGAARARPVRTAVVDGLARGGVCRPLRLEAA